MVDAIMKLSNYNRFQKGFCLGKFETEYLEYEYRRVAETSWNFGPSLNTPLKDCQFSGLH